MKQGHILLESGKVCYFYFPGHFVDFGLFQKVFFKKIFHLSRVLTENGIGTSSQWGFEYVVLVLSCPIRTIIWYDGTSGVRGIY